MSKRSLWLIALALSLLLAATGGWAEGRKEAPKTAGAAAAVSSGKYKEAPMLADLVKAGKLPEVTKRLPDDRLERTAA